MSKRRLKGTIVSDKMEKTVVVRVEKWKSFSKYRKASRIHKNYKADSRNGEYKIGDKVLIEECQPLSKDKKWRVVAKI